MSPAAAAGNASSAKGTSPFPYMSFSSSLWDSLLSQPPMSASSKNSLPLCIPLSIEAVSFFSVLNHPLGSSVAGFDELWFHFKLVLLWFCMWLSLIFQFRTRLIAPTFLVSFESNFFISTDILIPLFFPFSESSILSWRQDLHYLLKMH